MKYYWFSWRNEDENNEVWFYGDIIEESYGTIIDNGMWAILFDNNTNKYDFIGSEHLEHWVCEQERQSTMVFEYETFEGLINKDLVPRVGRLQDLIKVIFK